jgi:UDP-N-acetylmuramate-alanine ligase
MTAFGHRGAHYVGSMEKGIASVTAEAQPGDAIMTLGAGSVSQAGDGILAGLKA